MDHTNTMRRRVLNGIVALLAVLAGLSVWFLHFQIDSFDPQLLTLRAPPSVTAPLTQTLSTFTYRDEAGQEQTLVLQVRFRPPPADEPEVAEALKRPSEGQAEASSAATPRPFSDAAAAASFRTQTSIAILGIAFLLAATLTGVVACRSVHDVTGEWHTERAAGLAAGFAVGGCLLVHVDPVGPVVSHDIKVWPIFRAASDGLLFDLKLAEVLRGPMEFTSDVILISGIVAGGTMGLALHFLYCAVRQSENDPLILWKRKRHLGSVVTLASIALSLGIAMITAFLGWGANFLDDASRPAIEALAGAGGAYWGGMLTIFTLSTLGFTASCLHHDIQEAAMAPNNSTPAAPAAQAAPPEAINLAMEWRKKNDLEFDPLKTVGTVVAALGPVLTSVLIPALSKSLT